MAQAQISRFIQGNGEPVLSTLLALAKAGRVSVAWLIEPESATAGPVPAINIDLLKQAIESIEEDLADLELDDVTLALRAQMIAQLYEAYRKEGRKPKRRTVLKIIKRVREAQRGRVLR